jgi:hypothetical protein
VKSEQGSKIRHGKSQRERERESEEEEEKENFERKLSFQNIKKPKITIK